LDLYITGESKRDDDSLRLAKNIRDQKEAEMVTLQLDIIPQKKKQKADFIDFKEFYLKAISNKNHKNHQFYKYNLNPFLRFLKKDMDIRDITEKHINDYAKTLLEHSSHTRFDYINCLKHIFNTAIKQEIITKNPVQIRVKKIEKRLVYLTIEDIKQIFKVTAGVDMEVRNAFLYSCFTGLRKSDIYNLKWCDIEKRTVVIDDGSQKELFFMRVVQQKTGTIVSMELNEGAVTILKQQKQDREKVFDLVSYKHLRGKLKTIITMAGITKNVTFHTARHTFGTLGVTSGVPINVLMELMGHSDIKTTLVYAKIIDEVKSQNIHKYPKLTD
jgi:integrase